MTKLLDLLGKGPPGVIAAGHRRLRSLVRRLGDRLRDLTDGVETARTVEAPDIATTSANKERGIRYQPTPVGSLRKVLRALQIPSGEVFVDIGCGKGRVLILALEFGFTKIVGVDYSDELCRIARRNLDIACGRKGVGAKVLIHCRDAADYEFSEQESVIYLFNPFDGVVMAQLMARLAESLRRTPRRIWFVYHFPRWHQVVESSGLLRATGVHRHGGDEFAVYLHEPRIG